MRVTRSAFAMPSARPAPGCQMYKWRPIQISMYMQRMHNAKGEAFLPTANAMLSYATSEADGKGMQWTHSRVTPCCALLGNFNKRWCQRESTL